MFTIVSIRLVCFRCELDVSNFSEEFTGMPATDSPAVVPPNYDKIFKGYSYVAPSILFSKNVISSDLLKSVGGKDDTAALVKCRNDDSAFFQSYDLDLDEKILGDGSFSVCRRCVQKSTGKEYAVKIVSRKTDCTQEINLLRACQGHPNVVRSHEVIIDEGHTYLVLELLKGGELLDRIRKKTKFTESEASDILRKLVSAVSFMHSRGVVHRDLKPENLLFTTDEDGAELKVVDFGFARLKQEKEPLHTPCFTLHYAAPEVLNGDPEGYDENCDLWSLGVILYTMLCGRAPFHARSRDDNASAVMARIKGGEFSFSSIAWEGVSEEAKAVVRGLLTVNPNQRLRMADLRNNPWVQGSQNFLQTPLMTPDVLCSSDSAEKGLQTTFSAFHKAQREGFRLQDVLSAKLAQRRRLKKSSSDNNSSSSSFTSEGSVKSDPSTPPVTTKTKPSSDLKTETDSAKSTKTGSNQLPGRKDNLFSFGDAKVTEYLRNMSSSSLNLDNISVENSVSARTSESSYPVKVRESTDSSGIVVSDKNSIDSNQEKQVKKRKKKVYEQTRQSERIRRMQRREIDLDPTPFVSLPTPTRKRKLVATSYSSNESSEPKAKKKATDTSSTRKTKKTATFR